MRRSGRRGITLVETLVGALVLAVCAAPVLGCVSWVRSCAAETTTDELVASALQEQIALARSAGRTTALTTGSATSTKSLGYGVTLTVTRTIAAVTGRVRLYDVKTVGAWNARVQGAARSMTLESYVFAPDN